MPKVSYTKSELSTKDELERLFWIEIAKRKERQKSDAAYDDLVRLRDELSICFEDFDAKLEDPYHNGIDDFFDAIQFQLAVDDVVNDAERADVLRKVLGRFGGRARKLMNSLSYYKGFRLADFSAVTDLEALHGWWSWIITQEGRRSLGAIGRFSSQGEPREIPASEELRFVGDDYPTIKPGDVVQTVTSFSIPVRIPRSIPARKISLYSSDDHDVVIDGHRLTDRIVLEIDLLAPLPSMHQVELALRNAHRAARSQRDLALFEKGIIPKDWLATYDAVDKENCMRFLLTVADEHQLVTGMASVRPLLFGLYCWDLAAGGLSDAQASKQARERLLSAGGEPYYPERQALYGLTKVVRPRIELYEPEQLPWNS